MQDKELFEIALGIKSPWYISGLRMDAPRRGWISTLILRGEASLSVLSAVSCSLLMILSRGLGGILISFSIKPIFMLGFLGWSVLSMGLRLSLFSGRGVTLASL